MDMRDHIRRAGHPIWSAAGGAAVGALAALLVLAFVDWRSDPAGFTAHLRGIFSEDLGVTARAVLVSGLAGALLGGSFGRLTRRLFPMAARIVEGAVLLPALCIVVYAFGLQRYAPRVAESVPFFWSFLGALAFGVSIALVPPLRPRSLRVGPPGDG
jgi:hypothetical protein